MIGSIGPIYTDQIKRALQRARDIAIKNGNDYVSVEHLLASILSDTDSIAVKMLESEQLKILKAGVEKILANYKKSEESSLGQMIPFTPRVKKSLERTLTLARSLSSDYAGTEHLFLSLVEDTIPTNYNDTSPLASLILEAGITFDTLKDKIRPTASKLDATESSKYEWECWGCGATDHLSMVPHRNKSDHIVGIIASCSKCLEPLLGGSVRISPKDNASNA